MDFLEAITSNGRVKILGEIMKKKEKPKAVWLNVDVYKIVDQWARLNVQLGKRLNIQGAVAKLILTHPETQEFLPEKPVK